MPNLANKSADKRLRSAFETMLQKENSSTGELPPTVFRLHEHRGTYRWPGLEPRFRDFCAGARWFSDELNSTSSFVKHLMEKS